jgi:hypothetical protein
MDVANDLNCLNLGYRSVSQREDKEEIKDRMSFPVLRRREREREKIGAERSSDLTSSNN